MNICNRVIYHLWTPEMFLNLKNLIYYIFVVFKYLKNYKVVQILPGQTVTCLHTISPGHI
jgi:hypothetical protein